MAEDKVLKDGRMLRCAVVDDEPLALSLMVSYVEKTPILSMAGAYSSAVEALGAFKAAPVDLVFLDIQMPELDGLDFSRMIDKSVKIVFTTAFDRYAIDGYKVNAVDYLLKPISYKDFLEAVGRVLERTSLQSPGNAVSAPVAAVPVRNSIFVKSEYRYVRIYFDEVLYIEGMKDYVKIYVEGGSEPVLSLMSMKSLEARLPAGEFIRVHRSFIVRKDRIHAVERACVLVKESRLSGGGRRIPVGENYREQLKRLVD